MSNATVNDGKIHKAAVVSNADGTIDLYYDGELVVHNYLATNAKITDEYPIAVASNINNGNSLLAMKFYEARFWNKARTRDEIFTDIEGGGVLFTAIQGNEDGLQAWNVPNARTDIIPDLSGHENHITLYGNVEATFVYEVTFDYTANIKLKIYFLVDEPSERFTTLEDGFYQTEIKKCFNLPPSYNLWIDVDVWFDGTHLWRIGNAGTNGVTGAMSQLTREISFLNCDEIIQSLPEVCNKKDLQNVLLHMIASETEGLIEARVDGKTIYTYTGEVNRGEPFNDIFLQSDSEGTYFSSLLISTSEVPPERERTFDFNLERKVVNAAYQWQTTTPKKITGDILDGEEMPSFMPLLEDPDKPYDPDDDEIPATFAQTNIVKCFDLPPTYNIWIDFDVYFDGVSRWRAGNVNDNGICGITALTTTPLLYLSNGETVQAIPNVCKAKQVQPILLHMKSGEDDGIIESWVNGEKLYTYTGNVNYGEDFYDLFLQCDTAGTYFSNVTFSSDRLEPRSYIEPIYFCVRHNDEIFSFPLRDSDTPITNAFAVHYNGKNWYNALKLPTDENAGAVHIWHNATEYALSKTVF